MMDVFQCVKSQNKVLYDKLTQGAVASLDSSATSTSSSSSRPPSRDPKKAPPSSASTSAASRSKPTGLGRRPPGARKPSPSSSTSAPSSAPSSLPASQDPGVDENAADVDLEEASEM
ncbi:hypothetical protein Naga_102705g1 [Nannochloropsis gaditana]|uniref:Uncharacterized protein n=1 Tax=Nannochloropsis gaditana TaxID=72520 RepID=W7SYM3_9STRA|nr:hypothetical protein Naga_102705g1 [Nannochloropsis gaditana]